QIFARLLRRTLGNARRVGSHVRDETDRTLAPDLDALVEILSDPHRALRAERQLFGGFLLKRGRRERRRRILAALAALDLSDVEGFAAFEIADDPVGLLLVRNLRFLAVDVMELRGELLVLLLQQRLDGPILDRLERANLALALDDESKRDRLDATGRESLFHRLPQHWTRFVAHEPVEHASRLLRI